MALYSVDTAKPMSDPALISRRSLHDELVVLLHDMILAGDLKPGDKVSEQGLCQRFGVSRTPLREALKVLASDGLIHLAPNRGATIAQISREEVIELFPIMGALEALAGELAAERITDGEVSRLREMHQAMGEHYRRGETAPYLKLNRAIHEAIFDAAANAELTQLYKTLLVRTHAVRFTARKSPARWDEAMRDHDEMQAAIEARDGARLSKILKLHLRHKTASVLEALDVLEQADA
jgi:DNA-binding GntR family transcriptional regulator